MSQSQTYTPAHVCTYLQLVFHLVKIEVLLKYSNNLNVQIGNWLNTIHTINSAQKKNKAFHTLTRMEKSKGQNCVCSRLSV